MASTDEYQQIRNFICLKKYESKFDYYRNQYKELPMINFENAWNKMFWTDINTRGMSDIDRLEYYINEEIDKLKTK